MNDKDLNIDCKSNSLLHEDSAISPYDTVAHENLSSTPSASQRTVIPSGERKMTRHIFSYSHDISEDSSTATPISKRATREASRLSDPNISHNIDVASTYALQIALKNMREKYQKLQKKASLLEEENGRLINGKSELFSEIGKMQDSSIKLREKNLQLNHEVHSKHQECCSLQEQFSNVSKDNLKLSSQLSQSVNEKKTLLKQIEELRNDNVLLQGGLEDILSQCNSYPNAHTGLSYQIEGIASKILRKNQLDSAKTKIFPHAEDLENLEDFEKVALEDSSPSPFFWDDNKEEEALSLDACFQAKEFIRRIAALLQFQNQQLNELKPQMINLCKRKLDSTERNVSGFGQEKTFISNLAKCASVPRPSGVNLSSEGGLASGAIDDSGGETNVLVEEMEEGNERKVPFDWRKVDVSDDEAAEFASSGRPEMRTVSTSPDLTLTFELGMRHESRELSSEEGRTCPMCNAIFPPLLPQETFESHVVSHFEVENGFEVIS